MATDVVSSNSASAPPKSIYDLGDSIFYAEQSTLQSKINHEKYHIEKKVSLVFQCLAEHANKVVTREYLFDTVWPNMLVSDDSLNRCISVLRKVLRNFDHGLSIKTHPKIGFELVTHGEHKQRATASQPPKNVNGKVNGLDDSSSSSANKTVADVIDRWQFWQLTAIANKVFLHWREKRLFISLICLVVLSIGIYIYFYTYTVQQQSAQAVLLSDKRIVVLPFELPNKIPNKTPNPHSLPSPRQISEQTATRYQQLASELRSDFANHPFHTSVALQEITYENNRSLNSPKHIGQKLSARFVMQASIEERNNRQLLIWQLIDAQHGDIIVSNQLNLKLHKPEVNRKIVITDALSVIGKTLYGSNDSLHLDYIIKSAHYLYQPQANWSLNRPVISFIAQALVEVDPDDVEALKTLAQFISQSISSINQHSTPYQNLAIRILQQAIRLTPKDLELYKLLMRIYAAQYRWQEVNQTRLLAHANLPPTSPELNALDAELKLLTLQATPELVAFFSQAQQQQPLQKHYASALTQLYLLENQPLSAYQAKQSLFTEQSLSAEQGYWQHCGIALGQLTLKYGTTNDALLMLKSGYESLAIPERFHDGLNVLFQRSVDTALANTGIPRNELAILTQLDQAQQKGEILSSSLLFIWGSLGLFDRFYSLALSYSKNNTQSITQTNTQASTQTQQFSLATLFHLHTNQLISDPRFAQLMDNIGLKHYWLAHGFPNFCQQSNANICLNERTKPLKNVR